MGHEMDREMKTYFTVEHTVDLLQRCEQLGINTAPVLLRLEIAGSLPPAA